jgi:TRAP-type mannitol/chloroaromatic compound transport system permease small subunit
VTADRTTPGAPFPSDRVPRARAPRATFRLIRTIDQISYWSGKSCAWLIVALMLVVSVEVFKRYILNAPTAWIFDLNNMLYGTLFMLAGAYTLAQGGHVRADFVYVYLRPRVQAGLDLLLYLVFFVPGIAGLVYAGWSYAADSWRIGEHSTVTADGPPLYYFKSVIPLAGGLVLLQALAEIARCIECLRSGSWPARLHDVEEIDVVEGQLAHSKFVDEESRQVALGSAHAIDDAARHRSVMPDSERSER